MQRVRLNGLVKNWKSYIFCLVLCLLVIIDQFTKLYFHANFTEGETIVIIPDFFSFTLHFNEGAAWSFLANKDWGQIFFKILTPVVLCLFFVYYVFTAKKSKWARTSLILVFAGTIGNFIDRICFSYVVDFLSFKLWNIDFSTFSLYRFYFPVFNLADSFLVVGMIMLIIHLLFLDKDAIFRFKKNAK
ncbi:MAG: signal peptidase II [Clostridiales bacterium]|nr:signal peptidase II [Clostridiales bacterium]